MQQPSSNKPASLVVQLIATLLQFGIVGFIGALPLALLTAIIYSPQAGSEIWLLGAVLVGSYFPIRSIIESRLHGASSINYMPKHFNLLILLVSAMAFLFMIPVLWAATFTAMVIGLITYALLGQSVLLALVLALAFQIVNVYRQVKASPESGMNNFVMNFQDLSQRFGTETIVINPENVRGDEYADAPIVYHLPEQTSNWQPPTYDDEEIIILDLDDSEQNKQQD
jgi:hypothetical protein